MNPKLNSTISVVKISDSILEFFKTNTRQQLHIKIQDDTIMNIVLGLDGTKSSEQIAEEYDIRQDALDNLLRYLRKNGILDNVENKTDFKYYSRFRRVIHFIAEYSSSHKELVDMWDAIINSTVLIVGLGAVGSWVACNLAQSGVGKLILMDADTVDVTNLHRQFAYRESDVGFLKTDVIERKLKEYNPNISIIKQNVFLNEHNLREFDNEKIDLIINCADKPNVDTTSLWIGKYAMERGIAHIIGGGYNMHLSLIGQTVIPGKTACVNCFKRKLEEENKIDSSKVKKLVVKNRKVGSFGPMCSIIASMIGMEAIKVLTKKIPPSNINRRGEFDIYTMDISYKNYERRGDCEWCGKMENIIVINAKENNLKNINIEIPLNAFTCITGPSGCGKSSLIYDTLYAESQRNFLESMSGNMYGQKLMDKPKVDEIRNLHPALNVSQNYYNVNPRSTVGTVTDISYYLRSIFALYAAEKYNKNVDVSFFSANNPSSCCEKCRGLGEEYVVSEESLIPDVSKSLQKGGITYFKGAKNSLEHKLLEAICEYYGIDINSKISDLSENDIYNLLYREDEVELSLRYKTPKGRTKQKIVTIKGVIPEINEKLNKIDTPSVFSSVSKYLKKAKCSICGGKKLRDDVLAICIEKNDISDVEQFSLDKLLEWLQLIKCQTQSMNCKEQMEQLIIDLEKRVKTLISLNLEYLNLSRSIPSLSGGEVQRVRLSNQLSCSLSGLIYILDEPCKGLHYKNINSVIEASEKLIKKGNTLISIEHNKQYISRADKIIELGPVGGPKGGYITFDAYTKKEYAYDIHFKEKQNFGKFIKIKGINNNNLRNIDVNIPIGNVTFISGVSGSGKSSLTEAISVGCSGKRSRIYKESINIDGIKRILHVNQQPIGKTPRSTVVSYLEIYNMIRNKFASCASAISLGLVASDFSMNVEGGRCECCQGTGKKKIELSYLPETYIECPECHGKRFHEKVLKVEYNGYNIDDVLNKSIEEVVNIFHDDTTICSYLNCMIEMGMGYISLGQMSMNLSGGEAQRIKLSKCLGAKSTGNNLYILDEPTSGLNTSDIKQLEKVIIQLRNNNETIVIIEHNIEFISHIADYLIDLGSVAGEKGGNIIIQGHPSEVIQNEKSSWFGYEHFFDIKEHV